MTGIGRWMLCLAMAGGLGGCAGSPARSTRLTDTDLTEFSHEMALRLRESDWMRERDERSQRMVVTINKVENLTTDLLSRGEQWAFVARVRSAEALVGLGRQKNFAVVMPVEHLQEGKDRGNLPEDFAANRAPTHEMSATLRSATRSGGGQRTDVYLCEFRATRLADGVLEWTDTFEIKRAAVGLSYD